MCLRALEGRNYSPGLGRSQVYVQLIISQCALPSALEGPAGGERWLVPSREPGAVLRAGLPQLSAGWADLVPSCLLSLSLSQIEGKLEMTGIGLAFACPGTDTPACGR